MTAINPARLKIQAASLSEKAGNPDLFISGLHDLLTFYAARVRQTDLSKTPLTLQSYQVPPPVLRRLGKELEGLLNEDPGQGLRLVDQLWEENWVEFRQLAINILGSLPPRPPDEILNRVHSWLGGCTSENIRQDIIFKGLSRLSSEAPAEMIGYLNDLISSGKKDDLQAAIFGIRSLVTNPDYEDLPTLYSLLKKVLQKEETGLVKEINALIKEFCKEAEEETAYFLIQQLPNTAKPRIIRIIRSTASEFSSENKALLRNAVNKYS